MHLNIVLYYHTDQQDSDKLYRSCTSFYIIIIYALDLQWTEQYKYGKKSKV